VWTNELCLDAQIAKKGEKCKNYPLRTLLYYLSLRIGKSLSYRDTIGKNKQIIILVIAAGAILSYLLPLNNLLAAPSGTNPGSGTIPSNGNNAQFPGSANNPGNNIGTGNGPGNGNIGTGNGPGNGNIGNFNNGNDHVGNFCGNGVGHHYGCIQHNPNFTP
jgi:hypothetical protein